MGGKGTNGASRLTTIQPYTTLSFNPREGATYTQRILAIEGGWRIGPEGEGSILPPPLRSSI